ncbi:MAG: chorismate pyruvate-lyase family protein [Euryarchaeota archaeon]|nr:chorismate pyruvate-lyase family protein [Euryarchaeota archaeon]
MDITDRLYKLDLPTCLRICAGTDGSVTHLLELMTKKRVSVETEQQHITSADDEIARLLDIPAGEQVNERTVILRAGGVAYVYARSLAPIGQMPEGMEEDLMRADIPIGRIMQNHNLESRREIMDIRVLNLENSAFGKDCMVLSRIYRIIHDKKTLIRINEMFPIDDRWSL